MRNLEIKARCDDFDAARAVARARGAILWGRLRQVDTYYDAARGRLKLREVESLPAERPEDAFMSAELIRYDRPDLLGARASDFDILPVSEPARLHAALAAALGTRVQVRKTRELWLRRPWLKRPVLPADPEPGAQGATEGPGVGVGPAPDRIHLDTVDGLGTFIELELPIQDDQDANVRQSELESWMQAFDLGPADLLAGSYADLVRAAANLV